MYGPRQNPKGEAGVVAIFGGLLKAGVQPTIFGDGSKSRDYVYVGDIVHANLLALGRGKNVTVNLGRGELVSDKDIFNAVAREIGFKGKPKYAPYRAGEIYKISLDARKAYKILGWKSKTDLASGIHKTIPTI